MNNPLKNRSLSFTAIALSLFLLGGRSSPADDSPFLANALIHYKLAGKNEGTEELYIKGKKIRSITRIKTAPAQSAIVIDLLSIIEDSHITIVDLNQRRGTRVENIFKKPYEQMTEEEKKIFRRELLVGLPHQTQFEDVGREKVLGKECQVIQVKLKKLDIKLWIWNDLVLKSEITGPITFSKLAVSIDTNSPISEDIFQIPKDIKISDKQ